MAYHLHWSWSEIMDLSIDERRAFIAMLAERIKEENRAIEEMNERLRG